MARASRIGIGIGAVTITGMRAGSVTRIGAARVTRVAADIVPVTGIVTSMGIGIGMDIGAAIRAPYAA
ncbi:hypothetical protein AKI39_03835 [Bordetella sp. H567]|uniref:hypothetical protein n=1 Tax=Bordetella sp. H567 TaxID=1697043 RepID=UPI00081C4B16|nr:hypothetical protein [Bordetella sp. H567]AOB30003.1 hypothetical protein AKI39_03835 [Bordetella sp. H567]